MDSGPHHSYNSSFTHIDGVILTAGARLRHQRGGSKWMN